MLGSRRVAVSQTFVGEKLRFGMGSGQPGVSGSAASILAASAASRAATRQTSPVSVGLGGEVCL
jgi:hypothetical protein